MYNKLFTKILDSSVWLEDHATVRVWFTFMAAMDEDGFCPFASAANLANRARVTIEEARHALQRFESPDPDSSDPDNEGRRVERVPGGWIVLNAHKYKALATRENVREKTKERVAKFRQGQKALEEAALHGASGNAPVTTSETDTETYTETDQKTLALTADAAPAAGVFELPLIGGSEWQVLPKFYEELVLTYPGISVMSELQKMRMWLIANPIRGKTLKGMARAVNAWMDRAQNSNRGGSNGTGKQGKAAFSDFVR